MVKYLGIMVYFSISFTTCFAAEKPQTVPPKLEETMPVGRFQIFQGKYRLKSYYIGGTPTPNKTEYVDELFMLDTSTGKLYVCNETYYEKRNNNDQTVETRLASHCIPFEYDNSVGEQ